MCAERRINSGRPNVFKNVKNIASFIDHTFLKPEATEEYILKLCKEAKEYGFAAVCVNPSYVRLASRYLGTTSIKVCTVVGFPFGAHLTDVKVYEARRAINDGAREIDMVINIGALKSGDFELVYKDIRALVDLCSGEDVIVKCIIETALLLDEEKIEACQLVLQAGADFVKTSTGFGPGGASLHDVVLIRETLKGSSVGIKAAGGIRTYKDAMKMIEAGATRIGTSSGVKIVKEEKLKAKRTWG